jgi:2-phospho-L-lactate guanylyltransferase
VKQARLHNIGQVHAIVPVKAIIKSKRRLSALSPQQRAKLTIAMLTNVLAALSRSRRISSVTVVSGDKSTSKIAHRFGAEFLWEGTGHGLNRALRLAIRELDEGTTAMMIHADLPLLKTKDVDQFVARSQHFQIAIVPCKNGTGTNALLVRPPSAISPVFGKGSFGKHLSQAKRTGLSWKVLRIRGIQFDIDDNQDLRKFIRYAAQGRSFRFLRN